MPSKKVRWTGSAKSPDTSAGESHRSPVPWWSAFPRGVQVNPWAVVYRDYVDRFNPWTIFGSMLGFVVILMVGFVYAIKKGALDWKR